MTIGAIILGLAVTIGYVSKELHAADYLVMLIRDQVPAIALPAILTALCMMIAFSCGTSWGTYAVVFPIAMPLAWAIHRRPGLSFDLFRCRTWRSRFRGSVLADF